METLESLNRDYERISNWEEQYRQSLLDYLNKGLAFCGGDASIEVEHRCYHDAEQAGVDFDDQFPIAVTIVDRHGFQHQIYVTRFYFQNNLFYVDGYDRTDGEWIEGWYTDGCNDTYESLAYLMNIALNPEEEKKGDSILVGWQLMDKDNEYPSQLKALDVFRSIEDAETYRNTMLEPAEWLVTELWSAPCPNSKYNILECRERNFKSGERVCYPGQRGL